MPSSVYAASTIQGSTISAVSPYVAQASLTTAETLLSPTSGGTTTATNLIPAGCFLIGVTIEVVTVITGATSIKIGDGSDDDRWGATIAVTAGTTTSIASFTAAGYGQFTAANSVVITANGSNFTAGTIRVTAHYLTLTAAVS